MITRQPSRITAVALCRLMPEEAPVDNGERFGGLCHAMRSEGGSMRQMKLIQLMSLFSKIETGSLIFDQSRHSRLHIWRNLLKIEIVQTARTAACLVG